MKPLTLGLGNDLRVVRMGPTLGSILDVDPVWDSLSLLSLCPAHL